MPAWGERAPFALIFAFLKIKDWLYFPPLFSLKRVKKKGFLVFSLMNHTRNLIDARKKMRATRNETYGPLLKF